MGLPGGCTVGLGCEVLVVGQTLQSLLVVVVVVYLHLLALLFVVKSEELYLNNKIKKVCMSVCMFVYVCVYMTISVNKFIKTYIKTHTWLFFFCENFSRRIS